FIPHAGPDGVCLGRSDRSRSDPASTRNLNWREMSMSSEQRGKVIVGVVGLIGMTGLTIYVCRDGFSWWALLTGLFALCFLGVIGAAFEDMPSSGTRGGAKRSISCGVSGAAGLAVYVYNMLG